jgi:hypothetical protein
VAAVRLSSWLYRSARIPNDLEAGTSGDPKRMRRLLKNRLVGRLLGTAGIWRMWR